MCEKEIETINIKHKNKNVKKWRESQEPGEDAKKVDWAKQFSFTVNKSFFLLKQNNLDCSAYKLWFFSLTRNIDAN